MVCNNPHLLIIVEAQKNIFPWLFSISFNSHRFSSIMFNYSNLLEAWPTLLGSHMSYTKHTSHHIIWSTNITPLTSTFPPINHHPWTIILHKSQAKEGVEKRQPGWPPKVGGRPPTEGARPAHLSSYKLPLPASNFFTQAFQKTTQVLVSRKGALVVK